MVPWKPWIRFMGWVEEGDTGESWVQRERMALQGIQALNVGASDHHRLARTITHAGVQGREYLTLDWSCVGNRLRHPV